MTCTSRPTVATHVARRRADAVNWADRPRAIARRGSPWAAADGVAPSPPPNHASIAGGIVACRVDSRSRRLVPLIGVTWHRASIGPGHRPGRARIPVPLSIWGAHEDES